MTARAARRPAGRGVARYGAFVLLVAGSLSAGSCRGPTGPPLEPAAALGSFRIVEGFRIELVAAEPAVEDPVAIAFDAAGRLFVVEMPDYPMEREALGKIRLLEDSDGDGRFERSTLFAEGLHFPTSVMPWKGGVLAATAPDVLYLEDTDGDGRADRRRVVLTGFNPYNPQLRMNGLLYGMDNWIYAAYPKVGPSARHPDQFGRPGGPIRFPEHPEVPAVDVSGLGTDLRFRLDPPRLEPASGNSQFGNAFDARGNRFLLWNNNHVRHAVIAHPYLARNPYQAVASAMHFPSDHGDQSVVHPVTVDPVFIHDSQFGIFTSACGNSVDTGGIFPERYRGAYFVCEPVHNLVHADLLAPRGATFTARRAVAEREFLASTDAWFKPVFTTTGPDGALYVVDYYRKYVEHPDYVPDELEGKLDLRAGAGRGRIYRILPEGAAPYPRPRLATASTADLVRALDHPNLWWRITAQRLLVERGDASVVPALVEAARSAPAPETRIHALWTLDGLGRLDPELLLPALSDPGPAVREHAVRLADRIDSAAIQARLVAMSGDEDARVRFQLACTLGRLPESRSFEPLRRLALRDIEDPWVQIAVLTSAAENAPRWLGAVVGARDLPDRQQPHREEFLRRIAAIAGARRRDAEIEAMLALAAREPGEAGRRVLAATLAGLAQGIGRGAEKRPGLSPVIQRTLLGLVGGRAPEVEAPALDLLSATGVADSPALRAAIAAAAAAARNPRSDLEGRIRAVRLLALDPTRSSIPVLDGLVVLKEPAQLQAAAVAALWRTGDARVPGMLVAKWRTSPAPVREAALAGFFASPARLGELLDAIQAGRIDPPTLGRARIAELTRSRDARVRARAEVLFARALPADRKSVIDRYRPALTRAGDAAPGRAVFRTHCAGCHRIGDLGVAVGPDLVNLAMRRSRGVLMADILDPNQSIAAGFEEYRIETTDGRTLTGVMASDSATAVVLRRKEGAEDTVLRASIASLRLSTVSAMPEGLEEDLSVADLSDLLAYLKGVGQPASPPPGSR